MLSSILDIEAPRLSILTDVHRHSEKGAMEIYANGKVRVFHGHRPRTTIDLPMHGAHLVIEKFGPFEFGKVGEVDEIYLRKGHDKSQLIFAFADKKDEYGYDVLSPNGLIGNASGKRLDLLIASMFYDDPSLIAESGDATLDVKVKKYLKHLLDTAETDTH